MTNHSHESLSLWRHFNAALDAAALLAALARFRVTDREALFRLSSRQELQRVDLLHVFAYNARRAIELAEVYAPGIRRHSDNFSLPGIGESSASLGIESDAVPLTDQSLWWILGRIIHSRELRVHYFEDPKVEGRGFITVYQTPTVFSVRSDRDKEDIVHYARIERLLEAFVLLDSRFSSALDVAGINAERTGK